MRAEQVVRAGGVMAREGTRFHQTNSALWNHSSIVREMVSAFKTAQKPSSFKEPHHSSLLTFQNSMERKICGPCSSSGVVCETCIFIQKGINGGKGLALSVSWISEMQRL